ncbi:MAG: sialidase family protein, partial [Acidimicrobiales bacterium]
DRDGVAYATFISFGRADCDSYIAVSRSTDGGVTWSVPVDGASDGTGLVVGDGIAVHNGGPADCQFFHDKEWAAAGPRPEGAALVEGTDPGHVSADRLYVTWTRFDSGPAGDTFVEAPIYETHSDDQGRHWSTPHEISGSSRHHCTLQFGDRDPRSCDEDQFSVPLVDPNTGQLYVSFENFNTPGDGQYMVVRSDDGGETFTHPAKISDVADGPDRYPVCAGRQTLDLMCARLASTGNIDIDPTTGDLYMTWADNRNGTAADTNNDVFVAKSTTSGRTWSAPVGLTTDSIDDQWFPWLSVSPNGTVSVTYFDRRYSGPKLIDTSLSVSTDGGATFTTRRVSDESWNPDLAFRLGVFIGDYNGLDTTDTSAIPCWTDARFAEPNTEGNNPPHQQSDIFVAVEPL